MESKSIWMHALDCGLVAIIAMGTAMLACEEITLKIALIACIGGFVAGAIKFREYLSGTLQGPNMFILG
jgi:hypothetical protein